MDSPTLFSEIQEGQALYKRAPSLDEVCQQLGDGRRARGKRYNLAGLVVVLVLAKLAGMQSLLGESRMDGRISKPSCARDCVCPGNACRVQIPPALR